MKSVHWVIAREEFYIIQNKRKQILKWDQPGEKQIRIDDMRKVSLIKTWFVFTMHSRQDGDVIAPGVTPLKPEWFSKKRQDGEGTSYDGQMCNENGRDKAKVKLF